MATAPQQHSPEIHHLSRKPIDIEGESSLALPQSSFALQRAPELVLEEAAKAAQALRDVIERKPTKCVINGKTFLQFEDWQTLGRFYGITAAARTTTYIEYGRVRGFECHAEALLVSSDQVISGAQAMCLDDEKKWNDKPLFQLRSMAQTRAQAKALRNVLAWVVVMAGYAPTPAEEMDSVVHHAPTAAAGKSLDLQIVQRFCAQISTAATMVELQARYTAAGKEAQKLNDWTALDTFIRTKDVRKRELQ